MKTLEWNQLEIIEGGRGCGGDIIEAAAVVVLAGVVSAITVGGGSPLVWGAGINMGVKMARCIGSNYYN